MICWSDAKSGTPLCVTKRFQDRLLYLFHQSYRSIEKTADDIEASLPQNSIRKRTQGKVTFFVSSASSNTIISKMFFDLQKDTVVETFSSFDKFEILFSD